MRYLIWDVVVEEIKIGDREPFLAYQDSKGSDPPTTENARLQEAKH